jgi:hypothetical protein
MKHLWRAGILILVCTISGCIKDPIHFDIFPIKANPGKFECYINGKDYVPDSNRFHLSFDGPSGPVIVYARGWDNGSYQVIISASISGHGVGDNQEVRLQIEHVSGVGIYEFDDPAYQYATYTLYPVLDSVTVAQQIQPTVYNAPAKGHGTIILTRFDPQNSIIAGTFSFSAANNTDAADSVKVTGGHFNINYAIQ